MDEHKINGAIVIAACIVACIRLKNEPIERSPKVLATITDSVVLARLIVQEVMRRA